MPKTSTNAVANHRRQMKRQSFVRLEIRVRKEDAPLVRRVVSALADPVQAAEARTLLRECLSPLRAKGLKALLAAAPLAGIDLSRARDKGRTVQL